MSDVENAYLQALQQQWQALADLGGIVQADDPLQLPTDPDGATPDTWPDAAPWQAPPARLPMPNPVQEKK